MNQNKHSCYVKINLNFIVKEHKQEQVKAILGLAMNIKTIFFQNRK